MAKRKKRKETAKQRTYQVELGGIILILIAIIGVGRFGPVGKLIGSFGVFLFGNWWIILYLALMASGLYMIVKRELPNYFTSKLIGVYIVLIGLLVLSHMEFIPTSAVKWEEVIKATVDNFMESVNMATISDQNGGGIIGALFNTFFVKCFDLEGTKIVTWVLIICGFVMFTGKSLYDTLISMKSKVKIRKIKADKAEIKKVEKAYDEDNKIVISSIDDVIKEEGDSKEEKPVEVDEMNPSYHKPPITLLQKLNNNNAEKNHEEVKKTIPILEQVLKDFQIEGRVVAANIGPAVTQYELEVKAGTKVTRILSINREIALALGAKDVRIQAPIPGKRTIGIEIANPTISMVTVREILESVPKSLDESKLLATLGKDIMGRSIWVEINKTPHMLVSGATGSGKSVCINSMIISILMRTKPEEVKLVLVDPKKVELSIYNGVPHLMSPVVTDPHKANIALKRIVSEMERRYELFEQNGAKNIAGYNLYLEKKAKQTGEELRKMPYIVVIIDELADLMLVAAKDVEDSIMRITQMARAAGIHLIVATQRPSTDVITGVIKANIPSRIAFAVSSNVDSRTILDLSGAEKLLGKGDMLFLPMGENMPIRVQGTFISEEEIKRVVDFTIRQQKAKYDDSLLLSDEDLNATTMVHDDATEEPLYKEIVEFVVTQGKASASLLQRRFRLGYNRAARCIDLLEERGIVGPQNGSKPREVLVKLEDKE